MFPLSLLNAATRKFIDAFFLRPFKTLFRSSENFK
jgi:hypothetical protein